MRPAQMTRVFGVMMFVLAFLLLTARAHATDLTVKCVLVPTGVDGIALPADETVSFNIYGADLGSPLKLLTPTPLTSCLSVRSNVTPGTKCYAVTQVGTRNSSTAESAQTPPVCTTVLAPPAQPQSPGGVTVTPVTVATTVYMEIQVSNGFSFLAVGTVPLGTPCDATQRVNNFNVVPASAVTWTGKIHRLAALAACSIT